MLSPYPASSSAYRRHAVMSTHVASFTEPYPHDAPPEHPPPHSYGSAVKSCNVVAYGLRTNTAVLCSSLHGVQRKGWLKHSQNMQALRPREMDGILVNCRIIEDGPYRSSTKQNTQPAIAASVMILASPRERDRLQDGRASASPRPRLGGTLLLVAGGYPGLRI